MAGGKLTPRQRMINMMYLVLTAMLALNVSAEVLDAFVKIEQGLQQTSEIAQKKNDLTLESFDNVENKTKAKKWKDKADVLNENVKTLIKDIQDVKIDLIKKADGEQTPGIIDGKIVPEGIMSKENTEAVNFIMIGPNNDGKAYELKRKIEAFKETIFTIIKDDEIKEELRNKITNEINGFLNCETPKGAKDGRTWETFTFEGVPLISAVSMLTKIQMDILNSESSLLSDLFNQIDAGTIKFSAIQAVVKPITSSAVVKGTEFEAQVFLGAYDPTQKFTAELNSGKYESDATGKITVKRRADGIGMQSINGTIKYKGPDGDMSIPVRFEYQVVESSLVVSPDRMNVFYLGVDNPVSISVSGVDMSKISVDISNATVKRDGGSYIVQPKELKPCVVTVVADINGVKQTMPKREFRVKRVPTPIAAISGISGKTATKSEIGASQGIAAKMPQDFEFETRFTVKSFTVAANVDGYYREIPSTGAGFSAQQKTLMNSVRAGDAIMFVDIKATGPGGLTSDLESIVIKVK